MLAGALALFLGLAALALPSSRPGDGIALRAGDRGVPTATDGDEDQGSADDAGPGATAEAGASSTGGVAGATGGGPAGTGPGSTAGGPAPLKPRQVKTGFGVTATTIRIGIFVADFAGLQNVKGFNTGNPEVQARAVADFVNSNGGIAGRKVELFFGEMPATSGNWDADEQGVCSFFAEDAKVFAVAYTIISEGRTLQPCLSRHGIPLIAPSGGPHDQRVFDQNPTTLFYTGGLNMTRAGAVYVDGLVAAKFLAAGDKIGLVRPEDETYARASAEGLKPRLAAHGLKLADEAAVNAQTSLSDTAAEMPPVVLRFQQQAINKVLFLDNGTLGPLFVTQAGSQGYFPKYGFTSLSNPNFFVANTPPSTLAGSMGVGWLPGLDVDAQREPKMGPSVDRCTELMARAGEAGVDRTGVMVQRTLCDSLFFLKQTLDQAPEITPAGLAATTDGLGTSYPSAQTFATRFRPGAHDGAAQARIFAYDAGCRCYQYTGATQAVP